MTKIDLAEKIYLIHGGITKKEAINIVELFFDIVKNSLKENGYIVISGFGTLKVIRRKAKIGRIIKEGKSIEIPERNGIVFVPSKKTIKK